MTTTIRRGPRPLGLHLALAGLRATAALTTSCAPGSWRSSNGWPRSNAGRVEAGRIAAALDAGGHSAAAFRDAVAERLTAEHATLLAGVARYRRHPELAAGPAMPEVWREGGSRVLDFGGGGVATLFVPSLVNRATVLDLLPDASMLRWLSRHGVRPLLLDWGAPGALEAGFTLDAYVTGRLARALDVAAGAAGGRVVLAGYCMGGLLALAAAQRAPERVRALALLATPWDFWAEGEAQARALGGSLPALEPLLVATGTLPVDALQALFAMLDPFGVAAKYRAFAALDPASERARRFVAIEDWLNDGVALAAPVAREALGGWYGANSTARGDWVVGGAVVDPRRLGGVPGFVAVPGRDRIVPPATALALAGVYPDAVVHHAAGGHVGMVAGAGAEAALWRPLAAWVRGLG